MNDWTAARRDSSTYHGWHDGDVVLAHLDYLTTLVDVLLDRHLHALRAVSDALLERTILEGHQISWLREGRRCVCHPFIDHSDEEFPTSTTGIRTPSRIVAQRRPATE